MSRYFVAAAIVVAVLAVAISGRADQETQQTPGSKLTIMTCNPHQHGPGEAHPWIDPYGEHRLPNAFPYDEGFLTIDYKNDAKLAATEVDFALVLRDSLVATAKDTGTFSPGIKIQHEFVISREVFPIGAAIPYCAVVRVKYSDGSEWYNPSPSPAG